MTMESLNHEIIFPMNRATFITGATGFAGSKISAHLASLGMDLILSACNELKLQESVEVLSKKYPAIKVKGIVCDLSNPDSWSEGSEFIKEFCIDNYINCAGVQGKLGPGLEISQDEMTNVFNVNLFSSIYFTNIVTKNLQHGNKLSVIHFSGGGSTGPRPLFMPYSLSKTALLRFVENFAAENTNRNVRINVIAPGVMPSKMQEEVVSNPVLKESKDYLVAEKALSSRGLGSTKFIELCDFLLSDRSEGITGKLISAEWDNWTVWPDHLAELISSDLYTLRRITGRDRDQNWGDL
jgi:short-subunit dehydrogenase